MNAHPRDQDIVDESGAQAVRVSVLHKEYPKRLRISVPSDLQSYVGTILARRFRGLPQQGTVVGIKGGKCVIENGVVARQNGMPHFESLTERATKLRIEFRIEEAQRLLKKIKASNDNQVPVENQSETVTADGFRSNADGGPVCNSATNVHAPTGSSSDSPKKGGDTQAGGGGRQQQLSGAGAGEGRVPFPQMHQRITILSVAASMPPANVRTITQARGLQPQLSSPPPTARGLTPAFGPEYKTPFFCADSTVVYNTDPCAPQPMLQQQSLNHQVEQDKEQYEELQQDEASYCDDDGFWWTENLNKSRTRNDQVC
jgi:hypothetical protein